VFRTRWTAALAGIAALLTGLVAVTASAAMSSSTWPQTDSDAALSRFNPAESTLTADNVAKVRYRRSWVSPPNTDACFGDAPLSPVVADGRMYTVFDSRVYAVDIASGKVRWSKSVSLFGARLAVSDGRLFVGQVNCSPIDPGGTVEAFDAKSGRRLWSGSITNGSLQNMVVAGHHVLVGGDSIGSGAGLTSFNARTGAVEWLSTDCTAPVVVNWRVVSGCWDSDERLAFELRALRLADGSTLWSRPDLPATPSRADSAGSGGTDVFVVTDTELVDVRASDGTTRWSTAAHRVLAVDKQRVYVRCSETEVDTDVCALSRADGSQVWSTSNPVTQPVVAVAGKLVYVSGGQVLSASTGAVATTIAYGNEQVRSLVVASGRIFVGSSSRTIDVFGLPGS